MRGERGEGVDEGAAGRGGVQLLVPGLKADGHALELADDANEVFQGAAEPVERHHGVCLDRRPWRPYAALALCGPLAGKSYVTARVGYRSA